MPPSAPTPSQQIRLAQSAGSRDTGNGSNTTTGTTGATGTTGYQTYAPLYDKEPTAADSFQNESNPRLANPYSDLPVTVSGTDADSSFLLPNSSINNGGTGTSAAIAIASTPPPAGLWGNGTTGNSAGMGGLGFGATNNLMSPYSGSTMLGYGGAGAGLMSGYAGMLPGYMGGMMTTGTGSGPLSGVTQTLLGVQTLIASIGQTIQIVGMNAEAIQHMLTSAQATIVQAVESWRRHQHEWESYCGSPHPPATASTADEATASVVLAQDLDAIAVAAAQKRNRRRRQVCRWIMVTVCTYVGYAVMRKLLALLFRTKQRPQLVDGSRTMAAAAATAALAPYDPRTQYAAAPVYNSDFASYGGSPPPMPPPVLYPPSYSPAAPYYSYPVSYTPATYATGSPYSTLPPPDYANSYYNGGSQIY